MRGPGLDAEDVLQETWLRWVGVDLDTVQAQRAYLVRITTRQAVRAQVTSPGGGMAAERPSANCSWRAATFQEVPDIYKVSGTSRQGDFVTPRDRIEAVYDAYYPAIHQYAARRTSSHDDTADVISETFLTAWRRIGDVPEGEEALLWLYGVARRVLDNQQRGASRRAVLTERLRAELAADRLVRPVDLEHVRTSEGRRAGRPGAGTGRPCW